MGRGRRDLGLEPQWRERMEQWRASGLSVREFCLRRGLVETAFYYWRRELGARDVAAARVSSAKSAVQSLTSPSPATTRSASLSSPSPSPASRRTTGKSALPMFVPVTVLPDTVLPDAVLASATLAVEVRCPSGHVVLLSAWAAVDLAALFAALEPRASLAREEAQPC